MNGFSRMSIRLFFLAILSASFCPLAEAQEYTDIQVPGEDIWLQYPASFTLMDPGEESALRWDANEESFLEFGFGQTAEGEWETLLKDLTDLNEIPQAKAEGFGYLIEPRKVKIGTLDATELKVVIPGYALTEDGEEVLKTQMHIFVMEIRGSLYMCNMESMATDHRERYDEIILRLCKSVRTQSL